MNRALAKRLYEKGSVAEEKERFSQAVRFYKASLEADAGFQPSLMGLGIIHSRLGQTQLAIGFFLQAHAIQADAYTSFNLGSEAFKLGKYQECRGYLKECLHFDKRMLKGHLLLAYLYQKVEKYDKAAVYFQNALKINPKNRMAILGYAAALSQQGHYETALHAVEIYLKKAAGYDIFAQDLRAQLLLQLGRIEESYKDYLQLVENSPKFTSFSKHLESLQKEAKKEYKIIFESIDGKISKRVQRLKKHLSKRKALGSSTLSPHENGIEGSQDLAEGLKDELRDMVDLSLLYLFKGDEAKAMQYLFQARKQKERNNH